VSGLGSVVESYYLSHGMHRAVVFQDERGVAEFFGVGGQIRILEFLLIGKNLVMVLPEFSLFLSTDRGFGRGPFPSMNS